MPANYSEIKAPWSCLPQSGLDLITKKQIENQEYFVAYLQYQNVQIIMVCLKNKQSVAEGFEDSETGIQTPLGQISLNKFSELTRPV